MKKHRSIFIWITLIAFVSIACTCPLTDMVKKALMPAPLKTAEGLMEEAEGILTEMPLEDMAKTVEALASQVPMEELLTEMPAEEFLTQMPVDEDMVKTLEAGGLPEIPGLPGGGDENKTPPDIPLLPEPTRQNFVGNKDFVSYITTVPFPEAVDFYKTEMPKKDWTLNQDMSVETEENVLLYYEKPDRDATVSVRVEQGQTVVQCTIILK